MGRLGSAGTLAVVLIGAVAAAAAEPSGAAPASARLVVAEYMRAVPAGPALRRCKRVCVKSKSEGNRSAPMCLKWQTVC